MNNYLFGFVIEAKAMDHGSCSHPQYMDIISVYNLYEGIEYCKLIF
jgi:hypothetical protein